MPNRILKESITTSETVDRLSLLAECFFYRLIVNCDDYGRMDGRPAVLLARCFPLKIAALHETDIQQALTELVSGDFIFLYQNGHEFLQIKNWHSHQQIRAQRSKYPAPPGDDGNQLPAMDSGCSRNPIQSNPNRNPNPNPIRTPLRGLICFGNSIRKNRPNRMHRKCGGNSTLIARRMPRLPMGCKERLLRRNGPKITAGIFLSRLPG